MAGIEQSYLSKLENDKSVPSAEMFSTILAGLEMVSADGKAEIQMLDEQGRISKSIAPGSKEGGFI